VKILLFFFSVVLGVFFIAADTHAVSYLNEFAPNNQLWGSPTQSAFAYRVTTSTDMTVCDIFVPQVWDFSQMPVTSSTETTLKIYATQSLTDAPDTGALVRTFTTSTIDVITPTNGIPTTKMHFPTTAGIPGIDECSNRFSMYGSQGWSYWFVLTHPTVPASNKFRGGINLNATSTSDYSYKVASAWLAPQLNRGAIMLTGTSTIPADNLAYYLFNSSNTPPILCQNDFGFAVNPIRDLLCWLVVPSQDIENLYEYNRATLSTKVPWGYWQQISTGLGSVSSTQTTTSTALGLQVPFLNATYTVPIIDMTLIQTWIPLSVLTLIRAIGGVAMWALFGLWIWNLVTGSKPDDS
jgi:hypothetical protein